MAMTETHTKGRSSEETTNLYRQKYEAQISEWNARAEDFKARTSRLGARARLEVLPQVDAVQEKFETARSRLRALAGAADDDWEDLKRNAEQAWLDLRSSVEGAYDALKSQRKPPPQN